MFLLLDKSCDVTHDAVSNWDEALYLALMEFRANTGEDMHLCTDLPHDAPRFTPVLGRPLAISPLPLNRQGRRLYSMHWKSANRSYAILGGECYQLYTVYAYTAKKQYPHGFILTRSTDSSRRYYYLKLPLMLSRQLGLTNRFKTV